MKRHAVLVLVAALAGCAGDDDSLSEDSRPSGDRGLTQGGAQDIAAFRAVVDQGEVPSLALLDQVGFFAEHALDQPPADCGGVVCVHPMLAVAPRFGPGTWTMGFVSLNTPVDPESRPREPLHVVLAVERSRAVDEVLGAGFAALRRLPAGLNVETDRISVVAFGSGADIVVGATSVPSGELDLTDYLPAPVTPPNIDLYAGLAAASEAIALVPDMAARVVLLTSGAATGGIADAGRIEELAAAIARGGTSFSVIGMGKDYQAELPTRLADLGVGTYSYAKDQADLSQIIEQEGTLRLLPLATDVRLFVTPADGYSVGQLYGVKRAAVHGGVAELEMPALFVGARTGAQDVGMGRRGGGGGLFVELIADAARGSVLGAGQLAFTLDGSYVDVDTGETVLIHQEVVNELPAGIRPAEDWPAFSAPEYGKAFMMLNMYLALKTTLTLYTAGECGTALGVGYMMQPAIDEWQRRAPDPDIDADALLLEELEMNIYNHCRAEPKPPSNVELGCFFT
jgi:Ca-activated chloride channel homolog